MTTTEKPKHLTVKALLDACAHYGHLTTRWNPKMKPFIFGVTKNLKNKIYIIDLAKTMRIYARAEKQVRSWSKEGYQFIFVGTKRPAQEAVQNAAIKSGAYYVNHRWLGGLLTNFDTVRQSMKKMDVLEKNIEHGTEEFTKKERGQMVKLLNKMNKSLGGIRGLRKVNRDSKIVLIVADSNTERLAINEAHTLGFPVIAITDTNSDPDVATFPIPANDDKVASIDLIMNAFAETISEARDQKAEITPVEEPPVIEKN